MSKVQTSKGSVTFRSNSAVAIQADDLAVAEKFYSGVLHFEVVSRGAAQLAFDTGVLRLYANEDKVSHSFIPSFDVSDRDAAKRYLDEAGCKRLRAQAGASYVEYFLDPFGFAFDIVERG